MICDRLVCGNNDDSIQKCLLMEGDKLSLTKATLIAHSYETAEKDATELLTARCRFIACIQSLASMYQLQEHKV